MRFINDNIYPLFAALLVVVVGTCWFALPEPGQSKPVALASEPWSLPAPGTHNSLKAIEDITVRNLWGVVNADAANAAPPAPKWKVMGIARNGSERFILLAFEDKPITQLKVGDALPDGMKIVQIEDDRFFVMTADKKKIAFGMYKNDATP